MVNNMALANLITQAFSTEFLKDYGLGGVLYKNVMTKKLTGKMRGDKITFPAVGDDITVVTNRALTTPLAPNFVNGKNAVVELDTTNEIRIDFNEADKSKTYQDVVGEYSKATKLERDLQIDMLIAKKVALSPNVTKLLPSSEIKTPEDTYNFAGELIGLVLADLPKGNNIRKFLEVDYAFEKLLKEYYRKNITSNTALFEKDGVLYHDGFEVCRTPAIFNDGTDKNIFAHTEDSIGFASSLSNVKYGTDFGYNSEVLLATDVMGANALNGKYVSIGKYHPETV